MSETSMAERVARAISVKRNERRVRGGGESYGVVPSDFEDARAAIEAVLDAVEELPRFDIGGHDGPALERETNGDFVRISDIDAALSPNKETDR